MRRVGPAGAEPPGVRAVHFLSPRAPVALGRVVTVRFRTKARELRSVHVGDQDVTSRFHRHGGAYGGHTWVGRLEVGRHLQPGIRHVAVVADPPGGGEEAGTLEVLVAERRPSRRLMGARVQRIRKQWGVRLWLREEAEVFRAALNGHRLAEGVLRPVPRDTSVQPLGADDGLQPGTNRLRLLAVTPEGRWRAKTVRFWIPRGQPLVGAPDQRTTSQTAVALEARASITGDGSTPTATWRILSQPEGADPDVAGVGPLSSLLTPDQPGTYRVGAQVRQRNGQVGRDVVTVTVTPANPPIGVSISTMAEDPESPGNHAVLLGANCGAQMKGCLQKSYPYGNDLVQLLIFDSETLEQQTVVTYAGTAADASAALSLVGAELSKPEPGLVVLAALTGSIDSSWQYVFDAVAPGQIGDRAQEGGWSTIGIPTEPPSGDQNAGDNPRPVGEPVGALNGYLQLNIDGSAYTYVQGDYASYDTQAAGSTATQNVMTVDGRTFTADLPSGCAGGFHLVVLNADTFEAPTNQAASAAFATGCTIDGNDAGVTDLHDQLQLALSSTSTEGPQLVFLQSMGAPFDDTSEQAAADIAPLVESLGGTADVWNTAVTGGTGYALAGSTALRSDAAVPGSDVYSPDLGWGPEASENLTSEPAFLTGLLRRNERAHYTPVLGDAVRSSTVDLATIAYQTPQAWPTGSTSAEAAALTWLSSYLQLEYSPTSSCYHPTSPDVRFEYCDDEVLANAVALSDKVTEAVSSPAVTQQNAALCGCAAEVLTEVAKDIAQELLWVAKVDAYTQALRSIYLTDENQVGLLNLNAIATTINDAIDPPADAELAGYWTGLTSAFFGVLAVFTDGAAAAVLGGLSAFGFLAQDVMGAPGGTGLGRISGTEVSEFASQLEQRYLDAGELASSLADIIVGDYGKLQELGTNGDFQLDSAAARAQKTSMTMASYRFAYQELLSAEPIVALRVGVTDINPAPLSAASYVCYLDNNVPETVFGSIAADAWLALSPYDPPITAYNDLQPGAIAVVSSQQDGEGRYSSPPQSVLETALTSPATSNSQGVPQTLGEIPIWFFSRHFTAQGMECS